MAHMGKYQLSNSNTERFYLCICVYVIKKIRICEAFFKNCLKEMFNIYCYRKQHAKYNSLSAVHWKKIAHNVTIYLCSVFFLQGLQLEY